MRFPLIRIACTVLTACLAVHGTFAQDPPPSPIPSEPQATKPVQPAERTHRRHKTSKKVGPKKVIVHQGGATDAPIQIVPVVPQSKGEAERARSDRLLSATDANLKKLSGRKLTDDQQSLVNQIQQFMEQSRAALDAGDLSRGYYLASKANVLSEEFDKH
jgi:hypothetical protein